jgi:hypothetical protein
MVKTVLVPGAPWPKPEEKLVRRILPRLKIKHEGTNLDYFLDVHEQIKTSPKHSNRDKSGRFKND